MPRATPSIRRATHAGSWYSEDPRSLAAELQANLSAAHPLPSLNFPPSAFNRTPRAIIVPHAGYSYSGPAAAWAFAAIPGVLEAEARAEGTSAAEAQQSENGIKRVFVLGPSHHAYSTGILLTKFEEWETPLGGFKVDRRVVDELAHTGAFEEMSPDVDEAEHSLEMMMPYLRLVFSADVTLVPLMVGNVSSQGMKRFAELLEPYWNDRGNFWVISSDFCHWGQRFSCTPYYSALPSIKQYVPPVEPPATASSPSSSSPTLIDLHRSRDLYPSVPIWQSIQALDHQAIEILRSGGNEPGTGARFRDYLRQTRNTICGRNPILQLLAIMERRLEGGEEESTEIVFVRYEQSSKCFDLRDSSVSYVSGFVVDK